MSPLTSNLGVGVGSGPLVSSIRAKRGRLLTSIQADGRFSSQSTMTCCSLVTLSTSSASSGSSPFASPSGSFVFPSSGSLSTTTAPSPGASRRAAGVVTSSPPSSPSRSSGGAVGSGGSGGSVGSGGSGGSVGSAPGAGAGGSAGGEGGGGSAGGSDDSGGGCLGGGGEISGPTSFAFARHLGRSVVLKMDQRASEASVRRLASASTCDTNSRPSSSVALSFMTWAVTCWARSTQYCRTTSELRTVSVTKCWADSRTSSRSSRTPHHSPAAFCADGRKMAITSRSDTCCCTVGLDVRFLTMSFEICMTLSMTTWVLSVRTTKEASSFSEDASISMNHF
mmetsp:Transcript_25779/g.74353  ORF Transcript_25779/g.74353 Transcript_25779/m.74353 type:complete len:338 (+) Transcript_25779:967-1980(+)